MLFLFVAQICLLTNCVPPGPGDSKAESGVQVDLRNKAVQQVYDFSDRREYDSLTTYLNHPDPTLRYVATLAFASMADTTHLTAVAERLFDAVEDVRIAAAFALGQSGSALAAPFLVAAFQSGDSLSRHQRLNATILEAVGKCGSGSHLRQIAAVTSYLPTDTLLLLGLCRSIYRFGQRGMTEAAGTARMVAYSADDRLSPEVRLMAAHYLARTASVVPDSLQTVTLTAALIRAGNDPELRMTVAKALGKSGSVTAFSAISRFILREQDWRVTCNLIEALGNFPTDSARNLVMARLQDRNLHVRRAAARYFVQNGKSADADWYWRYARENAGNLDEISQILLYHASNKWLPGSLPVSKDFVVYRLREMYLGAKSPEARVACLQALTGSGWQYRFIREKGFTDAHPLVRSAATEALVHILKRPDFFAYFGEGSRAVRRECYTYLRQATATADAGMVAAAADGFTLSQMNFANLRDSSRIRDFKNVLGKLKMPRDLEAYMVLDKVIAFFEGRSAASVLRPAYNHPIDWQRLSLVSDKTEATLQTDKGDVVIEFYPQFAPGSVASFLDLAGRGEYNNKTFHRVVSNFVIQGGCPRGDGYGALDFSLRTEIGLLWYDRGGYVGMASAGRDTEGSQFFITHAATPHLDGRYTLFGRVKSGMEVVNQIQAGDVIRRIDVRYQ
jgi:cyclophilin family peptidyl-prolyl cis-trans isomerase/HEAT repeat protein